jgi:histidinol-phosphate aminotransferase
MITINPNFHSLEPYKLAKQILWEDKEKVKLKIDWNEENIFCDKVHNNLIKFISDGLYNYYPDADSKELNMVLSNFHNISKENVLTYPGSDEALDNICRTYLSLTDKITYRNPEYSNFYVFVKSSGAKLLPYYDENPFELNELALEKYIKSELPKMHYLSNPNNPTGILYSFEFLKRLIETNSETLFIVDEAYIHFSYYDKALQDSVIELTKNLNNLIVVMDRLY